MGRRSDGWLRPIAKFGDPVNLMFPRRNEPTCVYDLARCRVEPDMMLERLGPGLVFTVCLGCAGSDDRQAPAGPSGDASSTSTSTVDGSGGSGGAGGSTGGAGGASGVPQVLAIRSLYASGGGRVDWCKGGQNLIAFDRITSPTSAEVYAVAPDGTGEHCITCNAPSLPPGMRSQPAWDPTCSYLVIQVQGQFATGIVPFEEPGWGINNDLWLVAADGSWAEQLVAVEQNGASLHPHFSDTGEYLFWSVRTPTGVDLGLPAPGGENPWDGWNLAIAKFDRPPSGPATLSSRLDLYKGEGGFFESHALVGSTIWFSHTADGRPFVDDGYRAAADGTNRVDVTNAPGVWDEHLTPSPGRTVAAFMSSRGFDWQNPPDTFLTLRSELWVIGKTFAPVKLTEFNASVPAGLRGIVSDFDWSPDGREIAVYHVQSQSDGSIVNQAIDIVTLDAAY